MLTTSGHIKLNTGDDTLFDSPLIDITAKASYERGQWMVEITALLRSSLAGEVRKTYSLPGSELTKYDQGDGEFARNLGALIEGFVVADLQAINPDAEITYQAQ